MKQDEIVKILKNPPKPDLEGAKRYVLESDGALGITASFIKHWDHAGTVISALSMMGRKFREGRLSASERESFCRGNWGWGDDSGVKKAMAKAGVEHWQKSLPDGDKRKKAAPDDFQFYLSIHLGRSDMTQSSDVLYDRVSRWARNEKWPGEEMSGVNANFLEALESGSGEARKLLSFGYQNRVIIDGDKVVFIKLPKEVHLEMIRGRWRLSNLKDPAFIASSGRKVYSVRGVTFPEKQSTSSWRPEHAFDSVFRDGKCFLTVPQILALENTEQRRVAMETLEPEAILNGTKAVLIDGPTELGNELYEVDIGQPKQSWRGWQEGDPEEPEETRHRFKDRANKVLMLRYTCPSTDRVYAKFVPPHMKTADEAQAWSHHFTLEEYRGLKAQS